MSAVDQAAPISTDDLRKLLGAATPGPWEVSFRKNGSAYMSMGGHCHGERHKQFNIGLHDECADDIDDAGLIALAPQLAAEVLARRADLAAPSAPAEVEGLTDAQKIERMADLNWKPASAYWKEQHDAKATALTAQQAENERLKNWQDHNANEVPRLQMRLDSANARADKAEAALDDWKANAEALSDSIYAVYPDERAESALAAYAKLKGDV